MNYILSIGVGHVSYLRWLGFYMSVLYLNSVII